MKRYGADLAPQELLDEAAKILARDQARLSGLNYPVYKGQKIAPMSSLTQRARNLKEEFAKKLPPYSKKLESVLNRSNVGFSPQNIQDQLQMLGKRQQRFNENKMLGVLRNQFRESYEPRSDRFEDKGQKDIGRGLREASRSFEDIGRASGTLEQSSNQQLAKTIQKLQSEKTARREGLMGALEQFGAQKHGYTNLANQVAQNSFNQEASLPYKRMEMLQDALGPLSRNVGFGAHPDIEAQSGKDALQALRAYGIDVSAPVEEWGNIRTPPTYKGNLMADLPPEILASHSTLEAINPKFKDAFYDNRKALVGQLMTNPGVGQQAMEIVPERMRGAVKGLEDEAKQKLKKDLAAINQQFIRNNNYGSEQHIKAAEERAREISKATLQERNKLLQDTMKSELSLGHQGQIGNLKQLGLYGTQGQKEFADTLGQIRDMNKLGSTKWKNEQEENEELYKNYLNEAAWEWPHMKGAIAGNARSGALNDVFKGMERRNISLDELAQLNTNYSELQKENATRRGELDTRDKTIADLQKQLGIFRNNQAAQQARDAEAARNRALDEQREKNRLLYLQQEAQKNHLWERGNAAMAELTAFYNQHMAQPGRFGPDRSVVEPAMRNILSKYPEVDLTGRRAFEGGYNWNKGTATGAPTGQWSFVPSNYQVLRK